jgi:two-component system nitrate/nitrite response regulator NarL
VLLDAPGSRVSAIIILIPTHAPDGLHKRVAAGPVHGFLHKSLLSARAIRELPGAVP